MLVSCILSLADNIDIVVEWNLISLDLLFMDFCPRRDNIGSVQIPTAIYRRLGIS
jgi:hypothetical protein